VALVVVVVAALAVGARELYRPAGSPPRSGAGAGAAGPAGGPTAPSAAGPSSAAPSAGAPAGGPAPTAAQLAGQRVIYSYPGLVPPASLLAHIRAGEAAGVIFFGDNISSAAQIAGVIRTLRSAQRESPVHVPLLLMTDQEGGQVRRLPGQPALSAKQVGLAANPREAARLAGSGAAATLTAVGMNVNLAPVLDVYYAAGDFIDQQQRSFGSDAGTVAALGADFVAAQQAAGVAATAKHFPGLGSAARGQNTDAGPVTVPVTLSGLRQRDEMPYPAAVAAGVKLVMVSWAVYPALDSTRPAGLSPVVVGSELRGRIGFGGVTVTDALEAGALTAFGSTAQRAVLAAGAGMDLILCSARSVSDGESATTALAGALAGGQLDRTAFEAAVARVTALRTSLA
jgi:beta-N-acetylhexosaminidase